MPAQTRRKTSLTLNAGALDAARELGINVSAIADRALAQAVTEAKQARWLEENAEAFAAQSRWHEEHEHPLAEIMTGPGADTWRR